VTQLDRDFVEGKVAIEMVARGAAASVQLQGLRYAERVAPLLGVAAQRAGVLFRAERQGVGPACLVVGPRRSSPDHG
jgi:hypothetical protein